MQTARRLIGGRMGVPVQMLWLQILSQTRTISLGLIKKVVWPFLCLQHYCLKSWLLHSSKCSINTYQHNWKSSTWKIESTLTEKSQKVPSTSGSPARHHWTNMTELVNRFNSCLKTNRPKIVAFFLEKLSSADSSQFNSLANRKYPLPKRIWREDQIMAVEENYLERKRTNSKVYEKKQNKATTKKGIVTNK